MRRNGPLDTAAAGQHAAPEWVFVLGMHRSGTSCLAGILGAAGAHLGDVEDRSAHNAKGTRELAPVWQLNDDVLAASRGSWYAVPGTIAPTDEHRRRRDEILESLAASGAPVLCIKDPRLLLTLDLWLEPLQPEHVRLVGSVRAPAAVARSLKARDGFRRRHALRLWREYNRRLLALQESRLDGVVDFSLPLDDYRRQAEALVRRLGLRWTDSAGAFVEDGLRHSDQAGGRVPARDRDLYARLERLAEACAEGS